MTEIFTAFEGERLLASGPIGDVALSIKATTRPALDPILVFSDSTGRAVDLDLRGSTDEVLARHSTGEEATQIGRASCRERV